MTKSGDKKETSISAQKGRNRKIAFLLVTSAYAALSLSTNAMAQNTQQVKNSANQKSFNIAPQSLSSALIEYGNQSGLQVSVNNSLVTGIQTRGISGSYAPFEALSHLLSGTGLTWKAIDSKTIGIEPAPQTSDETIILGPVRVAGTNISGNGNGNNKTSISNTDNGRVTGWNGSADSVYKTAGSVSVVTREQLEAYPATAPADMLRSQSGVISGEARTSGGLDVNIRGLQGQGRVAMTVDGALNGTSVYRGYQGVSNRSFVDPDFISHIAIEKGPSMSSAIAGGIGGSVSMTTLNINDIVAADETEGLRIKLSASGNTSEPSSNMTQSLLPNGNSLAAHRIIDRPSFLTPTSGSGSLVYGRKGNWADFLIGLSYRNSGNYHVGTNGKGVPNKISTPSASCATAAPGSTDKIACDTAVQFYDKRGPTAFVGGEEVLNTSNKTKSSLVKAIIHPVEDHILELAYGGYNSKFGETYPGATGSRLSAVNQNLYMSKTNLDRYTARYRWDPDGDLVNLKINGWLTTLEESATSLDEAAKAARRYIDTWGADVSNASILQTPVGKFSADYGASYIHEQSKKDDDGTWLAKMSNAGEREEYSIFTDMRLEPVSWLQLNGGMRYQNYKMRTIGGVRYEYDIDEDNNDSEDAFSYSVGASLMPLEGLQIFANYKDAARAPSLMETARAFTYSAPDLHKEQAKNIEIGVNYARNNLFTADDTFGVKLAWFDNNIDGYISRRWTQIFVKSYNMYVSSMQIYNIDKAKFRGVELSANYKVKGFDIDGGITYYDNIEFCRANNKCINSSLASDYATNYIPPEWSANLSINKSFLNDRANIGARVSYRGERAVPYEMPQTGYLPLISPITWDAYTIVDLAGNFKLSNNYSLDWSVDNLTDRYYVEALSLGFVPSPGRTFRVGFTGTIGQGNPVWPTNWFSANQEDYDWTGPYVGGSWSYGKGRLKGAITNNAGNPADLINGGRTSQDMNNFLGGLQAGYNYQLQNNVVLGIEASIQAGDLGSWSGVKISEEGNNADALRRSNKLESDTNYKWDRLTTIKGKLGYSMGQTMVYGTLGASWLNETIDRNQYANAKDTRFADWYNNQNQGISTIIYHAFNESDNKTRTGYTLGAGFERAINNKWSITTDYSYSNFGKKTYEFKNAKKGIGMDYTKETIVGYNTIEVPGETITFEDGTEFEIPPYSYQEAIYDYQPVTGSSNIMEGRKIIAEGELHLFRIGINYRF